MPRRSTLLLLATHSALNLNRWPGTGRPESAAWEGFSGGPLVAAVQAAQLRNPLVQGGCDGCAPMVARWLRGSCGWLRLGFLRVL